MSDDPKRPDEGVRAAASLRGQMFVPSGWSLLAGGVIIAISVSIGLNISERERGILERGTTQGRVAVVREIERGVLDGLQAVERLASTWERRGGMPQHEFDAEAGMLARDFESFQGIGWVDPSFHVRWMVPLEGNEPAVDFDLGQERVRRHALETSRDVGRSAMSGPIDLVQGGRGFIAYVPLEVDGRFEGFIGGVWRADDFFSETLMNVARGFAVRITDEGGFLYSRDAGGAELAWSQALPASVSSRSWSVELAPLPVTIAALITPLPLLVVISGVLFALGFAITMNLARYRRLRNRELAAEIEQRQRAENELTRVLDTIPDHVWSGVVTRDGFQTSYSSSGLARVTGREIDPYEISLDAWYEIIHEGDRGRLAEAHAALVSGQQESMEIEYRIRAGDGSIGWVLARVRATPTECGVRLDGVTTNITEARRIQAERTKHQNEMLLAQERARMTREMHDGLGGQLVSTIAMLERGEASRGDIAEAVRRALDDMRIVIDSIDPRTTDLTTSLGKLRARIEPVLRRNGVALRWQVDDVPGLDDYPPEQTLHILRIIQEAVTNSMRHAKAREVYVGVHTAAEHDDQLSLEIHDDGCGFEMGDGYSGRGMRNIESRASALGAELRFESDGSGTRIELRVPLPPPLSESV